MSIPITWVDAFSDTPFRGNPAAVCLLDDAMDEARMQSLAFELGISETAYVTPAGEQLFAAIRFAPAVLFDDEKTGSFDALVRGEAMPAGKTFSAPSDGALVVAAVDDPRLADAA